MTASWFAAHVKSSRAFVWWTKNYPTIGFLIAMGAFSVAAIAYGQNGQQDRARDQHQTQDNFDGCLRGNVLRASNVDNNVHLVTTVIIQLGDDPANYKPLLEAVADDARKTYPQVDCVALFPGATTTTGS